MKLTRYASRPIRFLEIFDAGVVRLKVYGIAHESAAPRRELVDAGTMWAQRRLRERPTRQTHYGVGFLGIHDGRGENQVFLDQWVNENELLHTFVISSPDDPGALREAPADHNSVCIWDLAVQAFEREAWLRHVLANPRGPDLDGYLATCLNADL